MSKGKVPIGNILPLTTCMFSLLASDTTLGRNFLSSLNVALVSSYHYHFAEDKQTAG